MEQRFRFQSRPQAPNKSMIAGDKYRFTVLTNELIRMEYQEAGRFEDGATQMVVNRDFDSPVFRVIEDDSHLEIITEALHLTYNKQEFTGYGLTIRMKQNQYAHYAVWHYGEEGINLKGTARTLDKADGEIPLENGILSKSGYALLDDSHSLAMTEDGFVRSALNGHVDLYFFGYGRKYLNCLADFYHLCGSTPMLPRFALGNWWSRYYAYSDMEYLELMDRFEEEKLPFSVAVIDMDWHLTKLEAKYGNGWTGYTWNRELFPEPEVFLAELHKRGLKVTLNVHPADGVRGHEEMYPAMAKALDIDDKKEDAIPFSIANPKFLEAYFQYLHAPREKEGVDFWWIDWQQGKTSQTEGLDPLWMLNHYHYLDSGKNGKRPLTFSRYAGIGSHRYPIGFSGDTYITWESLDFQPYFTATASNVGYGWWSHDIGGHMGGYRDDELNVRWVQFGVFSPIMRLHSSKNLFSGKEPWKFSSEARAVMDEFLRLRHQLIPYLYTMNERFHSKNLPLVQPVYYQYPAAPAAYQVPNEYFFGSALLVNPITKKMNPQLKAGSAKTWLPKGIWFDLFHGLIYKGGRTIQMYRPIETIPVLAKAGSILPMEKKETIQNDTRNPVDLELLIFLGADGSFELYEDDGNTLEYEQGVYAKTPYHLDWNKKKEFQIDPPYGNLSVIPSSRNYTLHFYGITSQDIEKISVNGEEIFVNTKWEKEKNRVTVSLKEIKREDRVQIYFQSGAELASNQILWHVYEILNRAQVSYAVKEKLYAIMKKKDPIECKMTGLLAVDTLPELKEMISEIAFASLH